jgi:hypothetical protein
MLYRILFAFSLFLLLISIWNKIIWVFGWTIPMLPYSPIRYFELAAFLMIFVIAILLRQIRDQLQKK